MLDEFLIAPQYQYPAVYKPNQYRQKHLGRFDKTFVKIFIKWFNGINNKACLQRENQDLAVLWEIPAWVAKDDKFSSCPVLPAQSLIKFSKVVKSPTFERVLISRSK